jgi:hypothetical protein
VGDELSTSTVFLAPVPAEILESAKKVPALADRVAFGSNKQDLSAIPIGIEVFIYASQPPHPLCKPGFVTWGGKLGAIVPAVEKGPRSGKHPDPKVRPPFAESDDTPVICFWEVLGLQPLTHPIPLSRFKNMKGGKALGGQAPEWPVLAQLSLE